jgi:hypothetical protein
MTKIVLTSPLMPASKYKLFDKFGKWRLSPFSNLQSLLRNHRTNLKLVEVVYSRITKHVRHLVLYYNLESPLARVVDPDDASKLNFEIRGFLQCEKMADTTLSKIAASVSKISFQCMVVL